MNRTFLLISRAIFIILVVSNFVSGCANTNKSAEEIDKVRIDLKINRFDREFSTAEPQDIPILKKKYPYLFPKQYSDSIWVAKTKDGLQKELLAEVDNTFSDFSEETKDLELLFKHITYYFPAYRVPEVITVTTDVDYNNRIIMTDSLLLIGLDNYLGPKHRFYASFPKYIAAGLDKKFLISDVTSAFSKQVVPKARNRTFLAQMVYYGKELYVKDKLAPFLTDAQKINYSEEQLAWAKANEEQIWRNFIEEEHLYITDNKLSQRFLEPAPFSKFGLELDNKSPGRIGRYLGWQIVRAFMDKNKIRLEQMLRLPAEEIFKKSNYKPVK